MTPPDLSSGADRGAAVSRKMLDQHDPYADIPLIEAVDQHDPTSAAPIQGPVLVFTSFAELAARVDAAGPRRWLLRGVWPAGDYGVHAAEAKAGKTWNVADLAVSVASGTPWLGHIEVDQPGPVLMFVGEGGEANTVRRIRAVAAERNITAETLPIMVCTRAPHLANTAHIAMMAAQIEQTRPVLVTLDPLYLAAGGANLADLYGMGALLERPQLVCQQYGASLFVAHHFNRKQGGGAGRMSGAGPAEWGRVLISAEIKSRHTDPDTRATTVVTELDVIGGEVPDQTFRVTRRISSDNPDSLDAALHVTTAVEHGHGDTPNTAPRGSTEPPSHRKLLDALAAADGPRTSPQLVDWIAATHGHGLRRETTSRALTELERQGLVVGEIAGPFEPKRWSLTDHHDE